MFLNTSRNQRAKDLIRTSMNNYDENSKLIPSPTSKITLGKLLLNKGELENELSTLESSENTQVGGNVDSSKNYKDIGLLIIVTAFLFFLFIVIGHWIDTVLKVDKNNYTKTVGIITLQLLINIGLLLLPYFIISKYVKNNFLLKYYPLIFAAWVLSLKAQSNLISKFKFLLNEVNGKEKQLIAVDEKKYTIPVKNNVELEQNNDNISQSTSIDSLFKNKKNETDTIHQLSTDLPPNQNNEEIYSYEKNENEHFNSLNILDDSNHPNTHLDTHSSAINFSSPLLKESTNNSMVEHFNNNETPNFSYL
tara:strand:+ start:84 stop:1004 length:921 start_codon:yes stop_codon:yes gene_type:complete